MRFFIILAGALAVARAGSYGGGHGYGRGGGRLEGFNAHRFDVPVRAGGFGIGGGVVTGGASLRGLRGGYNALQYDVPVGTGVGYDVGFGRGSLTAGGSSGIYDTAIGGDVYMDDGYSGGFEGGFYDGSLANARVVDTDLGYYDIGGEYDDGFRGGQFDYGYNYGTPAVGPGSAVTVLTNRRRGVFAPLLDRLTGPRFELEQGYLLGPGGNGGFGGDIVYGNGVGTGYDVFQDDYIDDGNYLQFQGGGPGYVPVSGPVPYVGGGSGLYPISYSPGVAAGNVVGGAVNAVGNVAAGTVNAASGLANTALNAAGNFAQGAVQGVQQGVNIMGK